MDIAKYTIIVRNVVRTYCEKDWFWDTRNSKMANYNLWVVMQGKGTMESSTKKHQIIAGSSLFLRYNKGYLGTHNPEHPLHVIAARFDFADKDGNIMHPPEETLPVLYQRLSNLHFCSELFMKMEDCWIADDREGSALWLKTALHERQKQLELENRPTTTNELEGFILKLRQQIRENPQQEWQIEKLSKQAHCSRHHFSRKFRELVGVSPNEYIVRTRIDRAGELLISSSHSVERIAEIMGYNDVYFFSRQFKKFAGIPPSEYRRNTLKTDNHP